MSILAALGLFPDLSETDAHLYQKTIDFRGNDLESEEVELFSLKVGFPDEPVSSICFHSGDELIDCSPGRRR